MLLLFPAAYQMCIRDSPYNKVISIYEDSKQRLWFTMLGRGFCSFNQDTEEFTTYASSQGLANDVIYTIVEANNDILWLTSNKGLIRFDLKTHRSRHYLMGHAENTLNDNNIYSMCRTSAGQLYICLLYTSQSGCESEYKRASFATSYSSDSTGCHYQ